MVLIRDTNIAVVKRDIQQPCTYKTTPTDEGTRRPLVKPLPLTTLITEDDHAIEAVGKAHGAGARSAWRCPSMRKASWLSRNGPLPPQPASAPARVSEGQRRRSTSAPAGGARDQTRWLEALLASADATPSAPSPSSAAPSPTLAEESAHAAAPAPTLAKDLGVQHAIAARSEDTASTSDAKVTPRGVRRAREARSAANLPPRRPRSTSDPNPRRASALMRPPPGLPPLTPPKRIETPTAAASTATSEDPLAVVYV